MSARIQRHPQRGARRGLPFTRQVLLLEIALLFIVVGCGFGLFALLLKHALDHEFEHRALSVAQSVAADPQIARYVADRDQPPVQQLALKAQHATDALFVVVTDDRGIRYAHPNPAEIGKEVSTSPAAALSGHEVANIQVGTLGPSARGKVPLRLPSGRIVGEVSVGFQVNDISAALWRLLGLSAIFAGGALALGVGGSALLAGLLKRRTFGLEPADLAELVLEREAVLHSISEGVLAVDPDGRVTMVNAEASRLLGREVRTDETAEELDLPPRIAHLLTEHASSTAVDVSGKRVLVARHRIVERDQQRLGSVLTILDRTEIEQLTNELHAVQLMTQALRAQRHEFSNRLHTLHGLLQSVGPDDAREYLGVLIDAPAIGELDDGNNVSSATIRGFLAAKVAEAAESAVRLTLSETTWLPYKLLTPVEVITVLGNLVNNAVDAAKSSTTRPAWVEIDLLADNGELVVSVTDSGDGIDPQLGEAIFTQHVSSHGSARGLGLAIVRQVCESLGGSVRVTSTGTEAPTTFVARLPGVLDLDAPGAGRVP